MLIEKLHGMTNSWVSKFLLGLIAVAFVLSGITGYVFTRVDTSAVKINGEEISQQAFYQRYESESERLRQQLGAQFAALSGSPEFVAGLRQSVLNNLINQELLRQYADELKIGISDERVKQEIVTSQFFQQEGKFDNALYQRMLQLNGLTPDAYANIVREGLRLEQLQTGLAESEFIVPAQQAQLTELFFQARTVRLAPFSLDQVLEKQTISDEEVSAYYEANKGAFLVPELAKVQYMTLTRADVEKHIQVSDVEIAQYYQDNKALYVSQGQQRLSHIQVATEAEAKEIYQALQDGANFAGLASARSLDKISAENGGDLSWASAGTFPKAFEEAANALQVGQFSQPVKVDDQFHIILVTERKEPSTLPLEVVKTQIADQIRQNLVNNQYFSIEKQLAEKAFEHPEGLEKAAEVAGLTIQETDFFSANDVPAALNYPNVISAIFHSDISQGGVNSEPMNVGEQHAVLVRVIANKPEGTRSLEEAKADIISYLKRQKAEEIVLAEANQAAQRLNDNASSTLPEGVQFGSAEKWVFAENRDAALNNVIFAMSLTDNKPSYIASKASNGEVVLVELSHIEQGALSAAESELFTKQLAQARQVALQNTLLQALRAKAKIEVNEKFFQQNEEQ
ncbi:SurA N-terminal domain-containing protein [Pasteurella multocida]|uniref:SurA N-terminal domain-containing protein n=1 Tax=Pasteurella multocida TaxID=747 RepID=UPI00099D2E6E|nr:SurA N-terminal domain-containing protein [Pasteurella multocida]MCL7766493.1 SurA N-terminal domain-containing protein [Pasteurella multocida]MCL7823752.1 SurA N-terminal domain-containing protein [Pasteurella multocida]MCL7829784.1 SurA N-terminal domain-containing protein [Pasteurella multocida]MCL7832360.1 SurA N-terminal domain-containing protein [Pasteurella multocida]MDY0498321.1 SurA N-terminal domain-containing protein [Pasteurella multocida]